MKRSLAIVTTFILFAFIGNACSQTEAEYTDIEKEELEFKKYMNSLDTHSTDEAVLSAFSIMYDKLKLLESGLRYNDDFEPFLYYKVENVAEQPVVAFEVGYTYSSKEGIFEIELERIKLHLKPQEKHSGYISITGEDAKMIKRPPTPSFRIKVIRVVLENGEMIEQI